MSKDSAVDSPVSPAIRDMADKIKKELKIGDNGAYTVDKDFYAAHLPDSISMADVKRIQDHDSNLLSAVGLALGECSLATMSKKKELQETSLGFKMGRHDVDLGFAREKKSVNPKGGDPIVRNGVLSAKVVFHGAKNTAGSWKAVRSHLSDRGAAELGK